MTTDTLTVISPEAFLAHWQGHRALTRRVIDVFPEDQLFRFSLGGMRTFGQLASEMLNMAVPMVRGVATGKWDAFSTQEITSKAEILKRWNESTEQMNAFWKQIPPERFQEHNGIRPIPGEGVRPAALRHRQRSAPPRAGIRLPPRPRHQSAAVLRTGIGTARP